MMVVFPAQTIWHSDLIFLGFPLRNIWKPLPTVRPEMWASHNTRSEILSKNQEEKGWGSRALESHMEPQDGNLYYHSALRSSKHLLTWGSQVMFLKQSILSEMLSVSFYPVTEVPLWWCPQEVRALCVYPCLPPQSFRLVSSGLE